MPAPERYKFNYVVNEVSLERLVKTATNIGTLVVKNSTEEIRTTIFTTKLEGPFLGKVHGPVGSFEVAQLILEMFRLHNKNDGIRVQLKLRGLKRPVHSKESLRSIQEALLVSHRNVFPNE
jgi:dTDP-4-dehydrorhamnose reductase